MYFVGANEVVGILGSGDPVELYSNQEYFNTVPLLPQLDGCAAPIIFNGLFALIVTTLEPNIVTTGRFTSPVISTVAVADAAFKRKFASVTVIVYARAENLFLGTEMVLEP